MLKINFMDLYLRDDSRQTFQSLILSLVLTKIICHILFLGQEFGIFNKKHLLYT